MIKLRTAIPAVALSLASLALTSSCVKNAEPVKQRTEQTIQPMPKDKFEKSETSKKEKDAPYYALGIFAVIAAAVGAIIYDNKKMKEDPDYAKVYNELHGPEYRTGDE